MDYRVIKNRRALGPAWRVQAGHWIAPRTVGYAKGLNKKFAVEFEQTFDTKAKAFEHLQSLQERNHR